jgi:hypothetical protein
MIIANQIGITLKHDDATGDPSDIITIEISVNSSVAFVHTWSGSRHVDSTLSHEELRAFALDLLRLLRRIPEAQ